VVKYFAIRCRHDRNSLLQELICGIRGERFIQEMAMKKWLRRIRGALGMGLTWALVWAPVAVLIGLAIDPDGSMDEMWVAIGAYPGFLGGVVFSAVLAVAARRRRLEELSLPRVAAWGAAAGLLVGSIPFTFGEPASDTPVWLLATVVIGTITVLSATSAAGSLALARMGEKRELGAGADLAEVGLVGSGMRKPLGVPR
jgi:hypothetical protein